MICRCAINGHDDCVHKISSKFIRPNATLFRSWRKKGYTDWMEFDWFVPFFTRSRPAILVICWKIKWKKKIFEQMRLIAGDYVLIEGKRLSFDVQMTGIIREIYWIKWYHAEKGRVLMLFAQHVGNLIVFLSWLSSLFLVWLPQSIYQPNLSHLSKACRAEEPNDPNSNILI